MRDPRANVAMLFSLLTIPIIFAVGMGIDYTNAARLRSKLNAAADAAALAAVSSSAMMLSNSQAQALATNLFNGNLATIPSVVPNPSGLTVTIAGTLTRTATVSYTLQVKTFFAGIVGRQSLTIGGTSTASSASSPNINFYLLLDNSSSMALPATQAGITQMEALTPSQNPGGCAFACHEVNPNSTALGQPQATGNPCATGTSGRNCQLIDNYQLARNNAITLRIDDLTSAVGSLFSTAASMQSATPTPPTYQFSVYSINSEYQTGLFTVMAQTSSYVSGWQNNSSNLVLHQVYSYDQGCVYVSASSPCNSGAIATLNEVTWSNVGYFDSNISTPLSQLVSIIGTAGTGNSTGTPQKILFIVTDGVEDYVSGSSLIIQALGQTGQNACTTLKSQGVQIAVLYTTYFPTPGFFLYNDYVSPVQSSIATNLQNCAGTGLFQTAAPGDNLTTALATLFQSATNSAHLTQ